MSYFKRSVDLPLAVRLRGDGPVTRSTIYFDGGETVAYGRWYYIRELLRGAREQGIPYFVVSKVYGSGGVEYRVDARGIGNASHYEIVQLDTRVLYSKITPVTFANPKDWGKAQKRTLWALVDREYGPNGSTLRVLKTMRKLPKSFIQELAGE